MQPSKGEKRQQIGGQEDSTVVCPGLARDAEL
jgi:hypothetical protein